MTYRINGKAVTKEEFLASSKGFDYSKSFSVMGDYEGYECPITGKWVEGRASHRENLKRTGCRLLEKGEREQFVRERRENVERAIDRSAEFITHQIMERL